jgi:hypothetical protein
MKYCNAAGCEDSPAFADQQLGIDVLCQVRRNRGVKYAISEWQHLCVALRKYRLHFFAGLSDVVKRQVKAGNLLSFISQHGRQDASPARKVKHPWMTRPDFANDAALPRCVAAKSGDADYCVVAWRSAGRKELFCACVAAVNQQWIMYALLAFKSGHADN